jgi:hypothetical protein
MNIFLDACNCIGSWGAGIAKQFKAKVESTLMLASSVLAIAYLQYLATVSRSIQSP